MIEKAGIKDAPIIAQMALKMWTSHTIDEMVKAFENVIGQEVRHKGYAGELPAKCEEWAKEKGCVEFASDCELENAVSLDFHLKMGFSEASRIICFTKRL